jgi:hypothetical protein
MVGSGAKGAKWAKWAERVGTVRLAALGRRRGAGGVPIDEPCHRANKAKSRLPTTRDGQK